MSAEEYNEKEVWEPRPALLLCKIVKGGTTPTYFNLESSSEYVLILPTDHWQSKTTTVAISEIEHFDSDGAHCWLKVSYLPHNSINSRWVEVTRRDEQLVIFHVLQSAVIMDGLPALTSRKSDLQFAIQKVENRIKDLTEELLRFVPAGKNTAWVQLHPKVEQWSEYTEFEQAVIAHASDLRAVMPDETCCLNPTYPMFGALSSLDLVNTTNRKHVADGMYERCVEGLYPVHGVPHSPLLQLICDLAVVAVAAELSPQARPARIGQMQKVTPAMLHKICGMMKQPPHPTPPSSVQVKERFVNIEEVETGVMTIIFREAKFNWFLTRPVKLLQVRNSLLYHTKVCKMGGDKPSENVDAWAFYDELGTELDLEQITPNQDCTIFLRLK